MFLTEEENQKLTQVGPGTPGGELLRRYWYPVAGLHELTDESPTRFVRILGEDLVLFRDKSGRVGLLADHCSHRGAGAYPIDNIVEMAYAANWVQVVENHVDSTHIFILHQDTAGGRTPAAPGTTRGIIDQLTFLDYEVLEFGIKRNIVPEEGSRAAEDDLLVFPNMLRRVNQVQIHVPIDDTHTRTFKLHFWYERDGYDPERDQEPVDYYVIEGGQGKSGESAHPEVRYFMDQLTGQDVMAIETQGGIAPRPDWRVATGDRGVALYDHMLLREMDRVQEGHDPFGVVRDPNQVIDTNFEYFRQQVGSLGPQFARQGLQDPAGAPFLHGGAGVTQRYARKGPAPTADTRQPVNV